jgi:hypothetical protein
VDTYSGLFEPSSDSSVPGQAGYLNFMPTFDQPGGQHEEHAFGTTDVEL